MSQPDDTRHPHYPFIAEPALDNLALIALLGIVAAFSISLAVFTIRTGMPSSLDWWMIVVPLLPTLALAIVLTYKRVCATARRGKQ